MVILSWKLRESLTIWKLRKRLTMLRINGTDYKTISDAAAWFEVSVKTVRQWIEKGVIPKPPKKDYGTRDIEVFTDEYLEEADRSKDAYKEKKKALRHSQKALRDRAEIPVDN